MSAAKPMLFMNVPFWLYASFYFLFISFNGTVIWVSIACIVCLYVVFLLDE